MPDLKESAKLLVLSTYKHHQEIVDAGYSHNHHLRRGARLAFEDACLLVRDVLGREEEERLINEATKYLRKARS